MKKYLFLSILVFSFLFSVSAYSEIYNFKCSVKEQKIGDGSFCTNCASDDGLSFDLENNKILVSPGYNTDLESFQDQFIIKNSSKYFEWTHPTMMHKFRFNKFTYNLERTEYLASSDMNLKTGEVENPRVFFLKVLYECTKIKKI